MTLNKDTVTVESSGTFTNNSQYKNVDSDSTIVINGTFTNNNQYENVDSDSKTVINGTFNNNYYSFFKGTVTVALKAKIVNSSNMSIPGTMNMFGTLTTTEMTYVVGELVIKGVVENSAKITITSTGTISGSGRLSSTGVMNVYNELTMTGYVENGGSIENSGTITAYVENGGSISNTGTITSTRSLVNLTSTTSFINYGLIHVNNLINFGTMTNMGQLIMTGTLHNGGTFNNNYNEDTQTFGTTLVGEYCTVTNHKSFYTNGETEYTYTYISPISNTSYLSNDGVLNIRSGAAVGTDETKDQCFRLKYILYNYSTINIYHRGKLYIDGGSYVNYAHVNRVSDGLVLMSGGMMDYGSTNIWSGK